METIAIINHSTHECWLENIDEELLNKKYNGEEEAYIKDNYNLNGAEISWDYVTEVIDYSEEGNEIKIKRIN